MKFPANSASEFIAAANKKYGGNTLGETTPKFAWKYGGFKDGKLVKVEFTLSVDVDYAEVGSGSPDPENKVAIGQISAMTKDHEMNHKASYEKAFDDWDPKAVAKKLMDQSFKTKGDAEKEGAKQLKDLQATLLKACLDLHAKEGLIEMTQVITVKSKPAGASGCK